MPGTRAGERQWGGLLRQPDFRSLWIGETAGRLGSAATSVVLPLVAVATLGADSFAVGALSAASALPWLLISLPAGVWVDRVRRRPLMVGCDLVAAGALVSVPLAGAFGVLSLAHLFVVAFVVGVTTVVFVTAYRAYVPFLVSPAHLVEANAKLQGSEQGSQIAGRGLGGVLAQVLGPPIAIAVDVLGYLASALCLTRIRAKEEVRDSGARRAGLVREVTDGLLFIARDRHLRFLCAFSAIANLAYSALQALQIVFLVRDVGLAPGVVGFVVAASGTGGVVGALAASRAAARWGTAGAIRRWAFVTAPFAVLVPLTTGGPGVVLFAVGAFTVTAGLVAITVVVVAFRQAYCPPELLGRVSASAQFLNYGAIPLGTLIAGTLADSLGNQTALWHVAGVFVIYGLMPFFGVIARSRDLPNT
ncbi:MFS transporter [Actinosynnema sp. NPDC023587]|uniref:MFS transporter n=1 Tax=Actinosynnema sp. NPDC023587 TaxID=3154695 RepID=UPI00341097C6